MPEQLAPMTLTLTLEPSCFVLVIGIVLVWVGLNASRQGCQWVWGCVLGGVCFIVAGWIWRLRG